MKARIPNQGGGNSQAAMMKKLQDMQAEMARIQEEVEAAEYSASAGGGAVEVKVNGKHEVLEVNIKPEVVDPEDIEMLEDLITVALNEAISNAIKTAEEEMGSITGGMNIPGLF